MKKRPFRPICGPRAPEYTGPYAGTSHEWLDVVGRFNTQEVIDEGIDVIITAEREPIAQGELFETYTTEGKLFLFMERWLYIRTRPSLDVPVNPDGTMVHPYANTFRQKWRFK